MKIVNLAKTIVDVTVENKARIGPVAYFRLDHGQEWSQDFDLAGCALVVKTPNVYTLYSDLDKEWPNSSTMIIIARDNPRIIDYTAVWNHWKNKSCGLVSDQREEANVKTDEFTAAFFSALSSALGAMGPLGSFGAFSSALLGSLMSDSSAPPAPDIVQIESVMRRVVSSELDKNNARQGCAVFNLVAQKYWEVCSIIGENYFNNISDLEDEDKEKLANVLEFIDQYSSYNDSPGFVYHIELFCKNPTIAMYKAVEFLRAIVICIDIGRLKVIFDGCEKGRTQSGRPYPIIKTFQFRESNGSLFYEKLLNYNKGVENMLYQ